jgi:hypothetical protein
MAAQRDRAPRAAKAPVVGGATQAVLCSGTHRENMVGDLEVLSAHRSTLSAVDRSVSFPGWAVPTVPTSCNSHAPPALIRWRVEGDRPPSYSLLNCMH